MKTIETAAEWIARSAEARDKLIADQVARPTDFHVVQPGDDPTLAWATIYPEAWGERIVRDPADGSLICGWVREDAIPVGLVLYWPAGTDSSGEAYDADDPILYLQEVELWASYAPESGGPSNADQG
ncbi:hypothetical protein RCKAI_42 [Rhodobacter phage RcKai]|nr:hypothetical protein RCKAI_42 [Rhodobacter phage RcKai]